MKQKVCPRCGEPVPEEGADICMVCGQSLKSKHTVRKDLVAVVVLVGVAIALIYLLMPVFFGSTTVTSSGNVLFTVTFAEEGASVEFKGTADGRDVADLQIAILAEGGQSSRIFSFRDPQKDIVLGPLEIENLGEPVAVYYRAVYDDGSEISNTIRI